jgi:hypothetical protein
VSLRVTSHGRGHDARDHGLVLLDVGKSGDGETPVRDLQDRSQDHGGKRQLRVGQRGLEAG